MIDKTLIQRKLNQIVHYLDELEFVAKTPKQKFLSSTIHYEAERLIELIVGTALDINFHFIKELQLSTTVQYRDSFLELIKTKILDQKFAKRIANSAGLRNLLVHDYDVVDLDRLYSGLRSGISDYRTYVRQINAYLRKRSD